MDSGHKHRADFLVVSSKTNRYFLFHLGMQKALKNIMLIFTITTAAAAAATDTQGETTNSHLLFALSERFGMTGAYRERGGENIFLLRTDAVGFC